MRRIITLTALALGLTGGVAAADRDRHESSSVRDHRWGGQGDRGYVRPSHNNHRYDRGYDRGYYNRGSVRVVRRPIFANRDNRFYFSAGVSRPLYRPTIKYRYRDYDQRPSLIVENYDPVPGYVWNPGQWEWNGSEWVWISGHYDLATHTHTPYDGGYDDSGYDGYDTSGTTYPGYPSGY